MSFAPNDSNLQPATLVNVSRRTMYSFDVFDTLIARRCIEPHEVFRIVELRSGVKGFADARIAAERAVYHRQYGLVDIYGELQTRCGLSDEHRDALMTQELEVELETVLPINENLAALNNESLLITDTYLPEGFIRALLSRAGIRKDLPVLLESHGKSSGRLWKELRGQGVQCIHLGDNQISDIRNARAEGMRARLSTLSAPTAFEKALIGLGGRELAQSLRAARLGVDRKGMPEWLYNLQVNINIPFLLLSSLVLLSEAKRAGVSKVLFASRDGRNLQSAFRILAEALGSSNMRTQYWYTSRVARVGRSKPYLAYCTEVMQGPVLLADLCGTGASLVALLSDLGDDAAHVGFFLAEKISDERYVQDMYRAYVIGSEAGKAEFQYAFDAKEFIPNNLIEQLNYVPEGMVLDVAKTSFGYVPLKSDLDFDGEALALIANQHRYLTEFFSAFEQEMTEAVAQSFVKCSGAVFGWLHREQLDPARQKELAILQATIGIDDVSNEVGTLKQLMAAGASRAAVRDAG